MQKICLKIPGVAKPHSIIGNKLFEDERYYVIVDGSIHRKIPWENILYIEEVVGLDIPEYETETPMPPPAPPEKEKSAASLKTERPRIPFEELRQMAVEARTTEPMSSTQIETAQLNRLNGASTDVVPSIQGYELVSAQVFFEGHKTGAFKIDGVPANLLYGNWTPELSRHIFSNEQIRGFMGGFNVEKMQLSNGNVYIKTRSINDNIIKPMEEKIQMVGQMHAKVAELKDAGQKRFHKPTLKLDNTFAMTSSPFDAPISFNRNDDSQEESDAGIGEEAGIGEAEDS